MSINEQKLFILLDVINDKLLITSQDDGITIDPKVDLKNLYSEEELDGILLKLKNDEKIIRLIHWPLPEDSRDKETDSQYKLFIKSDKYNDYLAKLGYKKGVVQPIDKDIVFNIAYNHSNEILINEFFLLSKPNFDGENDSVFEFLINNPNKIHTKEDIEKAIERKLTKDLHKIIENLGFKGDFKKVFIQVTKQSILLRNPIRKLDLEKIGMLHIRLQR